MLKKISKSFLYFVLIIFIIFEFYYYVDLGEHRKLTKGEVSFLEEIFEKKIDYENIKIYPRKFLPKPIQVDDVALAPNGNVYFPEKYFEKDFSKDNFYNQAWLVHEVVHVRQYEKENQLMAVKGLFLMLKNLFTNFDPYQYQINYTENMESYNIEQQGDIARDYFLFKNGLKKLTKREEEWYKEVLKNF